MSQYSKTYKWFNVTIPQEWVAHVEINRADKLNAFHEPMWLELRVIMEELSFSPLVRSIVLSGAGPKAFTAGLDVHAAAASGPLSPSFSSSDQAPDGARTAAVIRRHIAEFQECITSVEKCTKPVIVVLHGFVYGLAIDLSTAADIRIAADTARFCVKEVDIGIAADIGTLTRLPKVVGSGSWVKEVCLSAREFRPDEALRVGLVSRVISGGKDEAMKAALELAGSIAAKSPVAVQGTKELLNWSRDRSVEDGLRYTGAWNAANLQSRDVGAAMIANIKKRVPTFEKL